MYTLEKSNINLKEGLGTFRAGQFGRLKREKKIITLFQLIAIHNYTCNLVQNKCV